MLDYRPLGMVEANGNLYFSGGGSLFKREDGPEPTYSEVLNLAKDLNTEMGGIRGLSVIDNPQGEGQSLIFMWAPGGNSVGEIKRLDPDGQGGYTVHSEVNISDLMIAALGGGVEAKRTLGAYNDFYPITNPATGETVHIIGFQAIITGESDLIGPGGYYKGAKFAIRTADNRYVVGEVNGEFEKGKPILIAPRTFAHSPFCDNKIFMAGNDTNFQPATDMAWIFSASVETVLAPLSEE